MVWIAFTIFRRDGATPSQQAGAALLAVLGVLLGAYLVWRRDGLRRRVSSEARELGFALSEVTTGKGMGVPTYPFNGVVQRSYAEIHSGKWRGRKVLVWALEAEPNAAPGIFEVVAMRLKASLPPVEMVPRRFLRGRRTARPDSITLESADFGAAWSVAGRDLRVAHAILNPRAMERLLAEGRRAPALTVCGPWAYSIRKRGQAHRGGVRNDLELLADVVDLLPGHVYQDHGGWTRADYEAGVDVAGSFATATREKNIFAWLGVACAPLFIVFPMGLGLGLYGRAQLRRRKATNSRVIAAAIWLNALAGAFLLWFLVDAAIH